MSRIEKTFRCPKDGRVLAKIEVSDLKRWLYIPGGRVRHTAALEIEAKETVSIVESMRESTIKEFGEEFYKRRLARVMDYDPSAPEHAVYEPRRVELPQEHELDMHRAGVIPMTYTAICPRCQSHTVLSVSFDEHERCIVLPS